MSGDFSFHQREVELTNRDVVHQIKTALPRTPGEKIVLGNGQGEETRAKIKNIGHEKIGLEILEVRPAAILASYLASRV